VPTVDIQRHSKVFNFDQLDRKPNKLMTNVCSTSVQVRYDRMSCAIVLNPDIAKVKLSIT
jgi:hypothetical protein